MDKCNDIAACAFHCIVLSDMCETLVQPILRSSLVRLAYAKKEQPNPPRHVELNNYSGAIRFVQLAIERKKERNKKLVQPQQRSL